MKSLPVCRIILFLTIVLLFTNKIISQNKVPLAIYNQKGWFYIDEYGERLTTDIYQKAGDFVFNDYAIVKKNNQFGAINDSLELVIPINYDSLYLTGLGDFIGRRDGLYYLIDQNNQLLLNKGYTKIETYRGNYKLYNNQDVGIYLRQKQQLIPPEYDNLSFFGKELLIISQNNKYGLINEENKLILQPEYEYIKWFNDSLIQYQQNGLWSLLTEKYIHYKCAPFKAARMIDDFWMVTYGIEKSTLLTYPEGVKVSAGVYDDFIVSNKKYISVSHNQKVGAINQKSKLIIDTIYQEVLPFNDDLFIVKSKDKYGVINSSNDTIIPFEFLEITPYLSQGNRNVLTRDGSYLKELLLVRKRNGTGIMNTKGELLIPVKFKEAYPINETFYVGKNNNAHYLYNAKGEQLSNLPFGGLEYQEGLIKARKGYCFSLFNKDSLIGSPYNDRLVIAGKVAKLYKEGDLEVVTFTSQGQIYDRFIYKDIPSYKVLGLPVIKNVQHKKKEETSFEMFFSQHLNKWGVRNKHSKKVHIKPCYDNVYKTSYGSVYKTENRVPTTEFSIAQLKFKTNTLYGYVVLSDVIDLVPVEYVWIDFPEQGFTLGSSTAINSVLHKNGKFNFAHYGESLEHDGVYSYIDERYNNCLRYNTGGELELKKSNENHYLGSLNDFVNRINSDHKIKAVDSTTIDYLMKDTVNLFISGGNWKYKQYVACEFEERSAAVRKNCTKPMEKVRSSEYIENGVNNYFIVQSGKSGLLNDKGIEVIPSAFVSIRKEPKSSFYEVVSDVPQYGYIKDSSVVIDQHYQKSLPFSEELAAVYDGEAWGYINQQEDTIIKIEYEEANNFKNGLALIKKDGKYGFINPKGEWVIPNKYSYAAPFKDGVTRVKEKSTWTYIDEKGNRINQLDIKKAGEFKGGYAIIKSKKGESIIDLSGEEKATKGFKKIRSFNSDVFIIKKSKKYAVFSLERGKKISKYYSRMGEYSDGLTWFKGKEGYGYLGLDGKVKIKGEYRKVGNFEEGRAAIKKKRKWGYINKDGEELIKAEYKSASPFSDGIAFVDTDSNAFAINKNGVILFKLNGRRVVQAFRNNLAIVSDKGKEFFINKNGDNAFNKVFDKIDPFQSGLAKCRIDGKVGVLNKEGEYEHLPIYNDIEVSNSNLLLFSKGNYEGVYLVKTNDVSSKGMQVVDTKYQKVKLIAPLTYRLINESYQKVFHESFGVIWDSRNN